jgi:hypothetical protein
MTSLNDREKAFESKFVHDQETVFKATARRNKLLGQWAAGELGLAGDEAEAYAKSVVMADFEEAGDEDVVRKVSTDFAAKGLGHTDDAIRSKLQALYATALEQVTS